MGCSLDGIPAGIAVDQEQLQAFLDRRAPGRDETATKRREADAAHIIAGVVDGHTTARPSPRLSRTPTRAPRITPSCAASPSRTCGLPCARKVSQHARCRWWRAFSGRLTAPLCIAGGIALQALEARGIKVMAHVAQIGGISDLPMDDMVYREADRKAILSNDLPCIDAAAAGRMREEILAARDELDSIGGIVECGIYGLPAGIGDPMFDGIENRIAHIAFGIPAVKGVEFGMGFAVAAMRGSENNDPYRVDAENGKIEVESNNAGGILGGISTGAPVMWRMAVKPTPSIGREQQTVDMDAMENAELSVHGRHDPCIVPRAVPVAEAAAALAIWDALLEDAAQR
ncbi:MAG: chorismate synthase [Collinsella sp.]